MTTHYSPDKVNLYQRSLRIGEIFGRARVICRDVFFLTARSDQPSMLHSLNRKKMLAVLENDIDNGFVFLNNFQGRRLIGPIKCTKNSSKKPS